MTDRARPRQPQITHGRTRTARLAMERLLRLTYAEEATRFDGLYDIRDAIPEAWAHLEHDVDVDEPRDKVTLYVDRSVLKFFRAMGPGYQARINRVLATYAQMKIADLEWLERMVESERKGRRDKDRKDP